MDIKQLFRSMPDENRDGVLRRLLNVNGMIASFFTFFEDSKLIEPSAEVLRTLFGPIPKDSSLYKVATSCYLRGAEEHDGNYEVEGSLGSFVSMTGSITEAMATGYWQLWLFAMRNFSDLTSHTPKKEQSKPKPLVNAKSEQIWSDLAKLAHRLHFRSSSIDSWISEEKDPDIEMAKAFLIRCRPSLHSSPQRLRENLVAILGVLKTIPRLSEATHIAKVNDILADGEKAVQRRRRRPYEESYNFVRQHLYLPKVLEAGVTLKEHLNEIGGASPFFVWCVILSAFFKYHKPIGTYSDPNLGGEMSSDSVRAGNSYTGGNAAPELDAELRRPLIAPFRRDSDSAPIGITVGSKRRRLSTPYRYRVFRWRKGECTEDWFATKLDTLRSVEIWQANCLNAAAGRDWRFVAVTQLESALPKTVNPSSGSAVVHLFYDGDAATMDAFMEKRNLQLGQLGGRSRREHVTEEDIL